MAVVKELLGKNPKFGENCFLAETAVIIGDVEMGDECSIWYNAVLRVMFITSKWEIRSMSRTMR